MRTFQRLDRVLADEEHDEPRDEEGEGKVQRGDQDQVSPPGQRGVHETVSPSGFFPGFGRPL